MFVLIPTVWFCNYADNKGQHEIPFSAENTNQSFNISINYDTSQENMFFLFIDNDTLPCGLSLGELHKIKITILGKSK